MPTTPSTARRDFKDKVVTVLTAFGAANPGYLHRVFRARPSSSPDVPYAYIDLISEDIRHDSGTRTRTFSGLAFVVVDRITDNAEKALTLDVTVDALVDWLTDRPQLGGTVGIWSRLTVSDEDAPFGDYDYVGVRFAFPDLDIMEGRE